MERRDVLIPPTRGRRAWKRATFLVALTVTTHGLAMTASAGAPTCRGRTASQVGTQGADEIVAGDGPDVIVGLGGADTIYGRGGNDLICGGDGNDSLYGSDGKDRLFGEDGDDSLFGERGSDRIVGGSGTDDLWGQLGSDRLNGGAGRDEAFFGAYGIAQARRIVVDLRAGTARGEGRDALRNIEDLATAQFECQCQGVTFIGNDERNVLSDLGDGPSVLDVFKGGGGNDTLVANTGPNRLLGGEGDDLFVIGLHYDAEGDGNDVIRGGAGVDTADFSEPYSPPGSVTVDLAAETATGPAILEDVLAGIENVIGTPGDDTIGGDDGPNNLSGGRGNDQLSGRGGDDSLDGGAGTNSNDGGEGTDECVNPSPSAGATACEEP